MTETELELRERLKDLVRAHKPDELEGLWLQEIVENQRQSDDFHQSIIRFLLNKKQEELLESLYSILIEQRLSSGDAARALQVIGFLLEGDPTMDFLRPLLINTLNSLYAEQGEERLEEFMRISGVIGDGPDLDRALVRFEELVGAARGQVFKHSQWGLGVVVELDPKEGWAILDFPAKPRHRMTLEGIRNYLRRIPRDHILAKIGTDKESYRQEVFDDPAGVVRLALKSEGPKLKAADLKKLLMGGLLTEAEYKRWWAKAKDDLRLDPHIEIAGKGSSIMLILRDKPRSFMDEVMKQMLSADTIAERRTVLREVAKHGSAADMSEQDVQALQAIFLQPLESGSISNEGDKLAYGALFLEYSDIFSEGTENPVDINAILTNPENDAAELIAYVGVFELQRLLLDRYSELESEKAPRVLADVFYHADAKLAAWIDKRLTEMGMTDERDHCIERILARPRSNTDLFVWSARRLADGSYAHLSEHITLMSVCEQVLSVIDELNAQAERAEGKAAKSIESAANRLRTFLMEGQNKYVKMAFRSADTEQARRFLGQLQMTNGLSNQLRSAIEAIGQREHSDLKKTSRREDDEAKKLAYHYALPESIEEQRKILSRIVSEDIPELAKVIGAARELGDLKENAEYHAAKDRQKLAMQKARELEDLLGRARPIDLAKVRTDEVRFGTRVTIRRTDNDAESTHIILGMWESDHTRGAVSYLTPFGSQLLNRKPDEVFSITTPDGATVEYQIIRIEALGANV